MKYVLMFTCLVLNINYTFGAEGWSPKTKPSPTSPSYSVDPDSWGNLFESKDNQVDRNPDTRPWIEQISSPKSIDSRKKEESETIDWSNILSKEEKEIARGAFGKKKSLASPSLLSTRQQSQKKREEELDRAEQFGLNVALALSIDERISAIEYELTKLRGKKSDLFKEILELVKAIAVKKMVPRETDFSPAQIQKIKAAYYVTNRLPFIEDPNGKQKVEKYIAKKIKEIGIDQDILILGKTILLKETHTNLMQMNGTITTLEKELSELLTNKERLKETAAAAKLKKASR